MPWYEEASNYEFYRMAAAAATGATSYLPTDPYDAALHARASGTWFDPTGATPYDRVIIRLDEVTLPGMRVTAALVGGGCGAASVHSFRPPVDNGTDFKMGGIVIYARGATPTLEIAVGTKISISSDEAEPLTKKTVNAGADGFKVTCPMPASGAQWLSHELTGGEGVTVKLSVRFEPFEEPLLTLAQATSGLTTVRLTGLAEAVAAGGDDHATLTYATREGNDKMVFWCPGRGDYMMHFHMIDAFLEAGYDVYGVDHRRLGRSLDGCTFEQMSLYSHTTDLRVYFDEFEKGLAHARTVKPYTNGCVLYAHSTGGLEASMWLRERGAALPFTCCVLNSPFLSYGSGGVLDIASNLTDTLYGCLSCLPSIGPTFSLMTTAEATNFNVGLWLQYPAIETHRRNIVGIGGKVTLGWTAACARAHDKLLREYPATTLPTLLLTTPGDLVLQSAELRDRASKFSSAVEVVSIPYCRHDMLLNYDMEQNAAVVSTIIGWLAKGSGMSV